MQYCVGSTCAAQGEENRCVPSELLAANSFEGPSCTRENIPSPSVRAAHAAVGSVSNSHLRARAQLLVASKCGRAALQIAGGKQEGGGDWFARKQPRSTFDFGMSDLASGDVGAGLRNSLLSRVLLHEREFVVAIV